MKVTAHFSSLLISVRPFTLLITIHSFHGSITASAYVATFYRGLTYTSLTGLNSSAFAVYPPTKRLALVECVKAPLLGQSCSIFTLRPSPLSLNHTTPPSNNMQTIHSFILLSFCSEPFSLSLSLSLSLCLESCLTHHRAWFCHKSLALNPDKTGAVLAISSALAINSIFYPLSHMSMLLVPRYIFRKKVKNSWSNPRPAAHFSGSCYNTVCSASFYHLRSFPHVRPALSQDISKTLGSTVIGAELDYVNSVFRGTSFTNIKRLPRVQIARGRESSWAHPRKRH